MAAEPTGLVPIGHELDESTAVAVAGISRALIEAMPDLDDVFALAVRCIGTLIDAVAVAWSLSPDGEWLESRGFHCADPTTGVRVRDAVARHRQRSSFGVLGAAVATRAPVGCRSFELALRPDTGDRKERDSFHQLVIDLDLDELMLVPLVSRDRVLGVIAAGRRTGAADFSMAEHAMTREVIDWTALALDNSMLVARLDDEVGSRHHDSDGLQYQADVLEHLSDAVISTDLDGVVRGWNDAASRLYGRDAHEMIGRGLHVTIPTTIVASPTATRHIGEHLFRDGQWEGEISQVAADGRRLELLATSRVVTDPTGDPTGFVTVIRDLTSSQRATQAQEALGKCVLDALPANTALLDRHGTIKAINRAWKRSVIADGGDLVTCGVGVNYLDVCQAAVISGEASAAPVLAKLHALLYDGAPKFSIDYTHERPGGTSWFILHVAPVDDEDGGAVVSHYDVTWRKRAGNELLHRASHDVLTGLPNRAKLTEQLATAIGELPPDATARLGVLAVDLDRFKVINDSLGHSAGDEVLRAVGERITGCVDEGDGVARLGGDEFVVLSRRGARDELTVLAERINDAVGRPLEIEGRVLIPTAGIGIVSVASGADPESVLADADDALYQAKARGPGQVGFFDTEIDRRIHATLDTELALRHAIAHGGLAVEYQSVIDTASGEIDGFEALVRWDHPTRGRIFPTEFIPVAEETGLIVPLGAWVLEQAVAAAGTWTDGESVAVNLSPVQLAAPGLVEMVEETLVGYAFPPDRLILEVTETALMRDREAVTARLVRLRELGIRISIDDFGTGYSSFAYLRQLPVDALKIDKSFVADLPGSGEAIVETIVRLADALGLDVIAEGVEREDQLSVLARMGCLHVQGFLFGRPAPADDLPVQRPAREG